ncbi:Re/Si-specific NAD(P)(+) transhydrogenase subunit alpha [Caballeronia sp. GaOx3]|uniref:Re/Si-specific NAD(P)(+) transhydrogenase subunit alpha n=1 Tax=Caballeronia sp. GaOx3 TaxID=2921740 RepID=UPI002027A16E|nr:Re/Si-specific NAD(P)(+) transhydrogenase subunit alpha [Caballeronia sp. GaOx3]
MEIVDVGVPIERRAGEDRVALSPEVVKRLVDLGLTVRIASQAGLKANFHDDDYKKAGASIVTQKDALGCKVVMTVRTPIDEDITNLKNGTVLIGMLDPFDKENAVKLASTGLTAFALEAAPRTTRAQALDVLSSQANIAGYKAALSAAHHYPRFMPMLMTAAGTVKAARVLVLGAGVAGLQAIATAKRLGAIVEASDVRPAVKEQIESLGAKFLDVPFETDEEREAGLGSAGYARAMPESWLARQAALVHERAKQADVVITTALIPGRPAPTLISADTVAKMKSGAVIVDLAAGRGAEYEGHVGGNCPLTETDKVVVRHGVTIVGHSNLAALMPTDASALYARNLLEFLKLLVTKEGALNIDMDDDIVAATLLTHEGKLVRKF